MLLPVIFAQKLFEKSLRDGNNFTKNTENAPSACGGDESVLMNWVSKGA